MSGLLVLSRRVGAAIHLDKHKARQVVLLLDDIEPRDAGFTDTFARIIERRSFESIDAFRLDPHMNVHDEHRFLSARRPARFQFSSLPPLFFPR